MTQMLWIKYDGNDSKKFDGNIYATDSRHRGNKETELKIGDQVIVNSSARKSSKKGRVWFGTIVEEPSPTSVHVSVPVASSVASSVQQTLSRKRKSETKHYVAKKKGLLFRYFV